MFISNNSSNNPISCLIPTRNGNKPKPYPKTCSPLMAKKRDSSQASSPENKTLFPWKLSSSNLLIQSAVGVFALGFVDAGYSGDWSRIGVISKGTEDLLKAAAFVVVPFCIFLVFALFQKDEQL